MFFIKFSYCNINGKLVLYLKEKNKNINIDNF